jgi:drug/metabolite transporter (DMT)-like permease
MEIFLEFFKNHWLAIAFLAPMFWALVNVIDVYFVDGIYKDELDGTIISGLFQIVPWFLLFFVANFKLSDAINFSSGLDNTLILSFAGGILYTSAFYFYFKTLFNHNDVSMLQILWNLTVIAVPVLSFLFFRESLPILKYAGMAIVLFGATMLSFNAKLRNKLSARYFWTMMGAVLFLSLSMIMEEKAYNLLGATYGGQGFWLGFFFFSMGAFTAGTLFAVYSKRNPFPLIRKYYKIFLLGEGIYFFGNLFSQKALDVAPSVSYVAVVETFVPVFILAYSLLILFLFSAILRRKNETIKRIYSEQIGGIWVKVLATIIMAVGVYIIS